MKPGISNLHHHKAFESADEVQLAVIISDVASTDAAQKNTLSKLLHHN